MHSWKNPKLTSFTYAALALMPFFADASQAFASAPDDPSKSAKNEPVSASETVGSLPYSTQWISERTSSYLYASYNTASLASSTLLVDQYVVDFGSQGYGYPSMDFFTRLLSFADPESRSAWKDWSLWGRYSLGFAAHEAQQISATLTPIDSSVEHDSLLVVSGRVGALLNYEHWGWVKPYAGLEIAPYAFRNTAGLSGAEHQGAAFCFGPVIGAHFPLFYSGRGSLVAELRRTIPIADEGQIMGDSTNLTAGAGLAF